jgi:folate-dependent phosphoribosylglycinamide formyltransferase PurN
MAMLELFLPRAMNAHPSLVPNFSGHYRLLLLVGQFGELMSHGQVTNQYPWSGPG